MTEKSWPAFLTTDGSDGERIALNIDVRSQLRLGSRFETSYDGNVWHVSSTTKTPKHWIALLTPAGFQFIPSIGNSAVPDTGFRCEHCDGDEFLEGPHGGMCVNFACSKCWARYNDALIRIESSGFVPPEHRQRFKGSYTPRKLEAGK